MFFLKRLLSRLGYVKLTDYNLALAGDGSIIAYVNGPLDPTWTAIARPQQFAEGTCDGITPSERPTQRFMPSLTTVLDQLDDRAPRQSWYSRTDIERAPVMRADRSPPPPPPDEQPKRFPEHQLLFTIIDDQTAS